MDIQLNSCFEICCIFWAFFPPRRPEFEGLDQKLSSCISESNFLFVSRFGERVPFVSTLMNWGTEWTSIHRFQVGKIPAVEMSMDVFTCDYICVRLIRAHFRENWSAVCELALAAVYVTELVVLSQGPLGEEDV